MLVGSEERAVSATGSLARFELCPFALFIREPLFSFRFFLRYCALCCFNGAKISFLPRKPPIFLFFSPRKENRICSSRKRLLFPLACIRLLARSQNESAEFAIQEARVFLPRNRLQRGLNPGSRVVSHRGRKLSHHYHHQDKGEICPRMKSIWRWQRI